MRKIKLGRVLILLFVPIFVLGIFIFYIRKDETGESTSYYHLDQFVYKDGLMSYEDSNYKTMTGIDISSFNKEIDFNSVKEDGIDFVVIRCGFRGGMDGILYDDPMYEEYMEEAKQAGLKIGIYFYSSAITLDELDEEVEYVLDRVKGYSLDLPIAYDMEYYNEGGRIVDLSKENKTKLAIRFCKKIKKAGYTPMIYGNMSWLYHDVDFDQVKTNLIWLASYSEECTMEDEFQMWQYSSQATVNGVSGTVDINLWLEKK